MRSVIGGDDYEGPVFFQYTAFSPAIFKVSPLENLVICWKVLKYFCIFKNHSLPRNIYSLDENRGAAIGPIHGLQNTQSNAFYVFKNAQSNVFNVYKNSWLHLLIISKLLLCNWLQNTIYFAINCTIRVGKRFNVPVCKVFKFIKPNWWQCHQLG